MADTTTPIYGFTKPEVGASVDTWGTKLNADLASIDADLSTIDTRITTAIAAVWSTGDVKLTLKTVADDGWVLMNDGTIGSALSGATTADDDTEDLFALLYTNIAALVVQNSAGTPVSRGVSAAADWAANRRLVLPAVLGRAIAAAGAGSGLTSRLLGATAGEENHTLTTTEMPSHNHSITDPTHTHSVSDPTHTHGPGAGSAFINTDTGTHSFDEGSAVAVYNTTIYSGTTAAAATGVSVVAAATGISTVAAGSGAAHNVVQPTSFLNVMIKL